MTALTRLPLIILLCFGILACTAPSRNAAADTCPLTEPVWKKPPEDAAVKDTQAYGYYFVNEDRSIWASAGWIGKDGAPLRVSEEGIKVGWMRPTGAAMEITGRRLDAKAPALESDIPCCYPTRFQATGIYFPSEGCWEVNAKAEEKELSFVVWVAPPITSP